MFVLPAQAADVFARDWLHQDAIGGCLDDRARAVLDLELPARNGGPTPARCVLSEWIVEEEATWSRLRSGLKREARTIEDLSSLRKPAPAKGK